MLLYALVENVIEKPDGIAISGLFIAGIVTVSLVSWIVRTTELCAGRIEFDDIARRFIVDSFAHHCQLHLIANKRQSGVAKAYRLKERAQRGIDPVPGALDVRAALLQRRIARLWMRRVGDGGGRAAASAGGLTRCCVRVRGLMTCGRSMDSHPSVDIGVSFKCQACEVKECE